MMTSTEVVSIDPLKKTVRTADGKGLQYDNLLFATGARPLSLSDLNVRGSGNGNIFTLRNEQDASRLVAVLESTPKGSSVVIVGGGYIGMEWYGLSL